MLLLAWGLPALGAKPKQPIPEVKLPLAELGFPGYPTALLHVGASMATLHVLDSGHLLFTYSMRALVPRLAGDNPADHDRLVAAEIVGVPSGKVLARTEWHLHDYGPYLWRVGQGLFVLRIGDALSTFAPLRGLDQGTAFQRVALPHRPGLPAVVTASADGQIVTVQLEQPPAKDAGTSTLGDTDAPKPRHIVVEFYRIHVPEHGDGPVVIDAAGAVGAHQALALPLDGDGYLWADDATPNRWALSFNEFGGKQTPLTAVDSSCSPSLHLVSRSEFVAVTCAGSDDTLRLSAFGFDGHEIWREPLDSALAGPVFVPAPGAGRFAMSRVAANGGDSANPSMGPVEESFVQTVRVYGTETGDLLFQTPCSPAIRAMGNFDLSADGRTLAVLGPTAIEVYTLPALSGQDRKNLQYAATMTPPLGTGAVDLSRIATPIRAEEQEATAPVAASHRRLLTVAAAGNGAARSAGTAGGSVSSGAIASGAPSTVPAAEAAPVQATGDETETTRKPPTLLEPGEQPEFKTPEAEPQ